jgi:hypothetical protein
LKTSFETKCGEPVILYRHFTGVNCSDTIAWNCILWRSDKDADRPPWHVRSQENPRTERTKQQAMASSLQILKVLRIDM